MRHRRGTTKQQDVERARLSVAGQRLGVLRGVVSGVRMEMGTVHIGRLASWSARPGRK